MQMQTDKTTALYYRVAGNQTLGLNLDNQMQQLLCYASVAGCCRSFPRGGVMA